MNEQIDSEPLDIERALDFSIYFADNTVVSDLGRDIEISFLQVSSKLNSVKASRETDTITYEYERENFVTELGRVRMIPAVAISMAVNILKSVDDRGALNVDLLIGQLGTWKSKSIDAEEKAG